MQCTQTLVEKEKRSASYQAHRHPTLTDEKKAKIKAFTKEFTHKLLKRLKDKGKLRRPSSASQSHQKAKNGSSSVLSTPSVPAASTPSASTLLETPRTDPADDFEFDDILSSGLNGNGHGADDGYGDGDQAGGGDGEMGHTSLDDVVLDVDIDAELEGADLTPLPPGKGRLSWAERRSMPTTPTLVANGSRRGSDETLQTSPLIQPVDRWAAAK